MSAGQAELLAGAKLLLDYALERGLSGDAEAAVAEARERLAYAQESEGVPPTQEDAESAALAGLFSAFPELLGVPTCRVCGCTDEHACPGGCMWVSDPMHQGDLCSNCLPRVLADAGVTPGGED